LKIRLLSIKRSKREHSIMENQIISSEIKKSLKALNRSEQKRVLEYIRAILKNKKKKVDALHYYGSIDRQDAESIKNAIENGCEKIDHNEW